MFEHLGTARTTPSQTLIRGTIGHAFDVSCHESNAVVWHRIIGQLRPLVLAPNDVGEQSRNIDGARYNAYHNSGNGLSGACILTHVCASS